MSPPIPPPTHHITPLSPTLSENAVSSFSTILTHETVSASAPHTGAYTRCADFLVSLLSEMPPFQSSVSILPESPPHSPVVYAIWEGTDPSLPIILLNSHYDVVPASAEDWNMAPPFSGEIKDNKMYGRGAQDMKCVCIQYIYALRKLSQSGYRPLRSILLTFVPDEEVGGSGMAAFLSSQLFSQTVGGVDGIALALDEGLASEDDTYSVFYGERLPWWITVTAEGNTGHGSRFIDNTAVGMIVEIANKALEFRKDQKEILFGKLDADHSNCAHAVVAKRTKKAIRDGGGATPTLGDVTTLNITALEAGVRVENEYVMNVVPPKAMCNMDIRISPHVPPHQIKDMLDAWCQECSSDEDTAKGKVTWDVIPNSGTGDKHATTSHDPQVNPWYGAFSSAMSNMGYTIIPQVFPAATDSRFLRALGIRALGFSPMRNSDILLHENDECLDVDVFLEGIGVYAGLIEVLASAGPELDL